MFTFKGLRLIVLATPLLLTMHLLTGCGTKEVEVKNYTSILCTNEQNRLSRNVVSLASGYFMFNESRVVPDFAEVKLNGKYATGKSELSSEAFTPNISERLRFDGLNSYNVIIASLLEMPEKINQNQVLKFSAPCQAKHALLDNEQLRNQPKEGTLYLLASKKSFLVLHGGSYVPEPSTPLKFKVLNPRTNLMEKVTIYLYQVVSSGDFVSAPSTFVEQIQNKIQNMLNWGRAEEIANNRKWSINRHTQAVDGQNYTYFSLTRESDTGGEPIRGEIQSVEFAPEEKE
jgi:hypothetical protein